MTPTKNIALFGGTFDPIHLGHLMIAKEAVRFMNLDEVRFLPCHLSPHKTDQPPTLARHRLQMVQLAIESFPWAVADDYELHSSGPSYSYLTVAETRRRAPNARIFWIMGCDQWEALPHWKEPEKLSAEVEFIVFTRGNAPIQRAGWRLHALKGEHPASSTAIREKLKSGQPVADWLPPAVLNYVVQNDLYTG